ncbi:AI-2E family transporter [Leucobacter sp. UT-8R-CII-1-4]|uniref:AI-2E family transporter n=1 Tax=Leucobacter sp. UT-8R-CII-1-4 TaxID=3040075 RepID=UPI0024A9FFF5|nr:AI-2E family transporter [Leucobacter sp. UT-8R-CII-1-4]MDI6023060.1 AI-2E family transporter [Leucobacter sp. UT-8R-CII-1-4]
MWFGKRARRRVTQQHELAAPARSAENAANANTAGVARAAHNEASAVGLWQDNIGKLATRALQTLIVLVLLAAIVWGLRTLSTVFIPIILALIFASTFWPVTKWLRAKNVPAALAAAIELVGILLLLTGIGWLVTWAVRDEWDELSEKAHGGFEQLIEWTHTLPFSIDQNQLLEWRDQLLDWVSTANVGAGAIAGVGAVASFLTGLVLMIVVLFFFLKDGPVIWRFLLRPFHGEQRERALRIGDKVVGTLGSYVRGTASVALVDAVGIGIGLMFLQVPLALPLAVLVFLLSFIPLVGATVAGILGALVALVANGPLSAVLVVGVVVLVNQLEGNFLQPVLMGRALKLHALVILLALTIGTVLSGILGAVLAVPIAAVLWGVIQVWDGPNLPAKWARKHPSD